MSGGRGADQEAGGTIARAWEPLDAATGMALLESLFGHAPVGLGIMDREFRFVRLNELLAATNGLPIADHIGRTIREIVPDLAPFIEPVYHAVLAGETVTNVEITGVLPSSGGDVRHWLLNCIPIRQGEEVSAIGVVLIDDTERRRVRDALRVRTDLYAMIARTNRAVSERRSPDALYQELCQIAVEIGRFRFAWVGVPDGDRMRAVASAGEDAGYLAQLVIPLDEHDPRSQGPTGRAARTGQWVVVNDFHASTMTTPWHEAGRRAGFRASAAFPLTERGRTVAVLTLYAGAKDFFTPELVETLSEITPSVSVALDAFVQERERRRDEEELRLRDRAIRAVTPGICITDARAVDDPMIYVSPGFEALTGYTAAELLGRNCRFLQGPETDSAAVRQVREAIRAGRGCTVDLLNYRKDGTSFWNELTISPVVDEHGELTHFVGVQTDVTERRRLELHMRQVQKMEAVGRLASGVAHDFNNLLTIVQTCSHLLLELLPADPDLRELVHEIRKAGDRGVTLTRQLLAFSRKSVVAPKVLDLNALVSESEKLLRRLIGEDVILSTYHETPLWPVTADPSQLEQVLINLVVNARDAMPTGGRLTIATGMTTVGHGAGSLRPGEYVTLEVRDTGTGMDEETRERIFEPFFTTKPTGRGTGLGLATASSIVEQAGGFITVETAPGHGSTFRIHLPRAHASEGASWDAPPVEAMPHGTETVLLVEDEDAVRALARRILERCGYTVLAAADGLQALDIVRSHAGAIHLLLSDVVMPHLGGRQLAERVRAIRPACRVLFVSGYTDDAVLRHGVEDAGIALLPKPYTPSGLAQRVRAVLDEG